jgi:hypothetical protein
MASAQADQLSVLRGLPKPTGVDAERCGSDKCDSSNRACICGSGTCNRNPSFTLHLYAYDPRPAWQVRRKICQAEHNALRRRITHSISNCADFLGALAPALWLIEKSSLQVARAGFGAKAPEYLGLISRKFNDKDVCWTVEYWRRSPYIWRITSLV